MAEEALAVAVNENAFDGNHEAESAAKAQTQYMHIEFLNQAHPFATVHISIWFCNLKRAFFIKFENDNTVLTELVIATQEAASTLQSSL